MHFSHNINVPRWLALSRAALCMAFALAAAGHAFAQGIGTAGAYAVDYGVQDFTAQGTPTPLLEPDSVTLGWGTTSSGNYAVVLGTLSNDDGQSNVVSVGDANTGLTRRLIYVAPGIAASDAATVGQLQSATSGLLSQANSYTNSAIAGLLVRPSPYATASALQPSVRPTVTQTPRVRQRFQPHRSTLMVWDHPRSHPLIAIQTPPSQPR